MKLDYFDEAPKLFFTILIKEYTLHTVYEGNLQTHTLNLKPKIKIFNHLYIL